MLKTGYGMIRLFLRKLREDAVSAFAAQTAFFIILSFLPFLIFLLTLLRFLPLDSERFLATLYGVFPPVVHDFIGKLFAEALQKTSGALLSVSVLTTLWAASRGVLVVVQGMNAVYVKKETRNYFVLRFLAVGYTLLFSVVLLSSLLLLVFGNRILLYLQSSIPVLKQMAGLLICLRTVLSFLMLALFFWALYLFVPNRKSGKRTAELPGAVVAAAGWLLFSWLYSFYIDRLSGFSAMYGSLTAIVLCMFWLYACMYLLFIGAELNVLLADPVFGKRWRAWIVTALGKSGIRCKNR